MGYKSVARHQLEPVLHTTNTAPFNHSHFELPYNNIMLEASQGHLMIIPIDIKRSRLLGR